mmetsp:Transcript_3881/g.4551  ORF Transcript_3881/g.4551 Transcript_3881/m.4551 type:complete len:126 (-) Transcript_3881:671-1048(-)
MPQVRHPLIGSLYFSAETITAMLGVFYFALISKHWFGYIFIGYCMQIVGTICCYFLPESPKYLFKKGSLEATVQVLKQMARTNGTDPELVTHDRVERAITLSLEGKAVIQPPSVAIQNDEDPDRF